MDAWQPSFGPCESCGSDPQQAVLDAFRRYQTPMLLGLSLAEAIMTEGRPLRPQTLRHFDKSVSTASTFSSACFTPSNRRVRRMSGESR